MLLSSLGTCSNALRGSLSRGLLLGSLGTGVAVPRSSLCVIESEDADLLDSQEDVISRAIKGMRRLPVVIPVVDIKPGSRRRYKAVSKGRVQAAATDPLDAGAISTSCPGASCPGTAPQRGTAAGGGGRVHRSPSVIDRCVAAAFGGLDLLRSRPAPPALSTSERALQQGAVGCSPAPAAVAAQSAPPPPNGTAQPRPPLLQGIPLGGLGTLRSGSGTYDDDDDDDDYGAAWVAEEAAHGRSTSSPLQDGDAARGDPSAGAPFAAAGSPFALAAPPAAAEARCAAASPAAASPTGSAGPAEEDPVRRSTFSGIDAPESVADKAPPALISVESAQASLARPPSASGPLERPKSPKSPLGTDRRAVTMPASTHPSPAGAAVASLDLPSLDRRRPEETTMRRSMENHHRFMHHGAATRSSLDGKRSPAGARHPAPPGSLSPVSQSPGSTPGASFTVSGSHRMLKLAHAIIAPVLPLVPLVLTKLAPVLPLVPLVLTKLAAAAAVIPDAAHAIIAPVLPLVPLVLTKLAAAVVVIPDAALLVLVPEAVGFSSGLVERAVKPDVFVVSTGPTTEADEAAFAALTALQRVKFMQEKTLSLIISADAGPAVAGTAPDDVLKCATRRVSHTSRRGSLIGAPTVKAAPLRNSAEAKPAPVTLRKPAETRNEFGLGARVASFSVAVLVAVFAYYGLRLAFATAADLFALAATAGFMIASAAFVKRQYSWRAEAGPLAPGSLGGARARKRVSLVTRYDTAPFS